MEKAIFLGRYFFKLFSTNFTPMNARADPARISVKKCAPTTTLLKATIDAKKRKKYLILGNKKEITKANVNIVEEWPDGKEWYSDAKLKKLNSKLSSKDVWFGLGRPIKNFNNWVKKPTTIKETNKKIEKFLQFVLILLYFLKYLNLSKR